MKTQREVEAAIRKAVGRFEREHASRASKDSRMT
jgi:hypothetical protein